MLTFSVLTSAAAAATMTPADALASLEGDWQGALQYRDYQSNEIEEIPLASTIDAVPDRASFVQRSRYTDPGFDVHITSLWFVDEDGVAVANARAGRPFEMFAYDVDFEARGETDWTLVLTRTGLDDDRQSIIRETYLRTGDRLQSTKDVDYLDDPAEMFEYRNGMRLERVAATAD